MADHGGKDTRGNCINRSVRGTWVKMQEIINKIIFAVGSEQNKVKTSWSPPACWTGGTQSGSQHKGQAQLWWGNGRSEHREGLQAHDMKWDCSVCKGLDTQVKKKGIECERVTGAELTQPRHAPQLAEGAAHPSAGRALSTAWAAPRHSLCQAGIWQLQVKSIPTHLFCLYLCAYSKTDAVKATCTQINNSCTERSKNLHVIIWESFQRWQTHAFDLQGLLRVTLQSPSSPQTGCSLQLYCRTTGGENMETTRGS